VSVVVDASAIIAVALQERDVLLIESTQDALRQPGLFAPEIMPSEVAGGIAMAEWSGRCSPIEADMAWDMASTIIGRVACRPIDEADAVFALCRRYRLRGADANYLHMAIDRRAALLTGDKRLADTARDAGVALLYEP
jgi:predicted nucleic acid-binding protein